MANSVEMRVPLLDTPLFEYAMTLEIDAKIKDNVSKYALRQLASHSLPKVIAERALRPSQKGGYGFSPKDFWVRGLRDYAFQRLDEPLVKEFGVFNPQTVKKRLQTPSKYSDYRLLWNMALTHDLMEIFGLS